MSSLLTTARRGLREGSSLGRQSADAGHPGVKATAVSALIRAAACPPSTLRSPSLFGARPLGDGELGAWRRDGVVWRGEMARLSGPRRAPEWSRNRRKPQRLLGRIGER
jgi:hypothetical protein